MQSIQPLVQSIRSTPANVPLSEADQAAISDHINDISRTVQATAFKTNEATERLGDAALTKHARPVVNVLEECRQDLLEAGALRERIPPLAFKTARAMKVR